VKHSSRSSVAVPVSEVQIAAMLEWFAGAAQPLSHSERRRSHRRWRRLVLLIAVGLLSLAVAVPALALHRQIAEGLSQFLADEKQPQNAKEMVKGVARGPLQALPLIKGTLRPAGSTELPYTLTSVREVIAAQTPSGEIRLYELSFSNGYRGSAMISVDTQEVGGAVWGPDTPCPSGWALKAGGGYVTLPGQTPLFVSGRVGEAVASVKVAYPDGHTAPAAVGDGYFLGWVIPTGESHDRANYSPPVTLIARNSAGKELGHLSVRSDGDIPPSPSQPAQAVACG